MADDIMPEEAVRRRQLGIQNRELDAKLRSMREAGPVGEPLQRAEAPLHVRAPLSREPEGSVGGVRRIRNVFILRSGRVAEV